MGIFDSLFKNANKKVDNYSGNEDTVEEEIKRKLASKGKDLSNVNLSVKDDGMSLKDINNIVKSIPKGTPFKEQERIMKEKGLNAPEYTQTIGENVVASYNPEMTPEEQGYTKMAVFDDSGNNSVNTGVLGGNLSGKPNTQPALSGLLPLNNDIQAPVMPQSPIQPGNIDVPGVQAPELQAKTPEQYSEGLNQFGKLMLDNGLAETPEEAIELSEILAKVQRGEISTMDVPGIIGWDRAIALQSKFEGSGLSPADFNLGLEGQEQSNGMASNMDPLAAMQGSGVNFGDVIGKGFQDYVQPERDYGAFNDAEKWTALGRMGAAMLGNKGSFEEQLAAGMGQIFDAGDKNYAERVEASRYKNKDLADKANRALNTLSQMEAIDMNRQKFGHQKLQDSLNNEYRNNVFDRRVLESDRMFDFGREKFEYEKKDDAIKNKIAWTKVNSSNKANTDINFQDENGKLILSEDLNKRLDNAGISYSDKLKTMKLHNDMLVDISNHNDKYYKNNDVGMLETNLTNATSNYDKMNDFENYMLDNNIDKFSGIETDLISPFKKFFGISDDKELNIESGRQSIKSDVLEGMSNIKGTATEGDRGLVENSLNNANSDISLILKGNYIKNRHLKRLDNKKSYVSSNDGRSRMTDSELMKINIDSETNEIENSLFKGMYDNKKHGSRNSYNFKMGEVLYLSNKAEQKIKEGNYLAATKILKIANDTAEELGEDVADKLHNYHKEKFNKTRG